MKNLMINIVIIISLMSQPIWALDELPIFQKLDITPQTQEYYAQKRSEFRSMQTLPIRDSQAVGKIIHEIDIKLSDEPVAYIHLFLPDMLTLSPWLSPITDKDLSDELLEIVQKGIVMTDKYDFPSLLRIKLLVTERALIFKFDDPEAQAEWRKARRERTARMIQYAKEYTKWLSPETESELKELKKEIDAYIIPVDKIKFPNAVSLSGHPPAEWIEDLEIRKEYQSFVKKNSLYRFSQDHIRRTKREYEKRNRKLIIEYIAQYYGAKPFANKELMTLLKDNPLDDSLEKDILERVREIQSER